MFKLDKDGFLINEKGEFVDIKGNKVEKGIKLSDIKIFTEEDLNKARTDEKGKLYSQIEKSQQTVENLTGKITETSKQLSDAITLINELKKKQEGNEEDDGKKDADVNAKFKRTEDALTKQINLLSDTLKSLETKLSAETQQREFFEKQLKLDRYKNQKIREVGEGNLILDLVSGNTEEEIDLSIENSKKKYLDIKNRLLKDKEDADKLALEEAERKKKEEEDKRRNTPVVSLKTGGQQDGQDTSVQNVELTAEKISSLSNEDFAKNRENLKAEFRKQYTKK